METVRTLPVPPLMLGEGPVWHARRETLYFVDIDGCMIYGWQDGPGLVTRLPMPDRTGFVVPWGEGLRRAQATRCIAWTRTARRSRPSCALRWMPGYASTTGNATRKAGSGPA